MAAISESIVTLAFCTKKKPLVEIFLSISTRSLFYDLTEQNTLRHSYYLLDPY